MGHVNDIGSVYLILRHAGKIEGIIDPADEHEIVRSGSANGIVELLHAHDLIPFTAITTIAPNIPRNIVRLVVQLEQNAVVTLVFGGNGLPELNRILIRHPLLFQIRVLHVSAVRPMQIEDDVETRLMGPLHRVIDVLLVVRVVLDVSGKPEPLIEGETRDVCAPARDFLKIGERNVFALRIPFMRGARDTAEDAHVPIAVVNLVSLHVIAARGIAPEDELLDDDIPPLDELPLDELAPLEDEPLTLDKIGRHCLRPRSYPRFRPRRIRKRKGEIRRPKASHNAIAWPAHSVKKEMSSIQISKVVFCDAWKCTV